MKKAIAAIVSAIMAATLGGMLIACAGTPGKDGVNGIDGTAGTPGQDGVPGENGASAYELFVKSHPDYAGDERTWLNDMAAGRLSDRYEYNVVSFGRDVAGVVTAGKIEPDGAALAFSAAAVKLNENIVMPIGDGAEWEINFGGSFEGGQFLVSQNLAREGKVYLGIRPSANIMYIGIYEGGYHFNYCWDVSGSIIGSAHEYKIRYADGVYTLAVDGGAAKTFSKINQEQSTPVTVGDAKLASKELNDKIRASTARDYFEWTGMGTTVGNFPVTAKLDYLDITTSSIYTYKPMSHHPLYGKTVYHLGSSISYGSANSGVSFAEQIAGLTGSKYYKETVSGTTLVTTNDNSYVQRFAKLPFDDDPAFLVLQLSTNDFSQNKPLGNVTGANIKDGFNTETVCGAIEYIVSQTKKKSPDTKVIVYTCKIKQGWGKRAEYGNFVNTQLKAIAEKWGITVVDLFNTETVDTSSWMNDDIHPKGYEYANHFTPAMVNTMVDLLGK